MIQRIFLTCSAVLLLASVGAFFLYVPFLSILTVASMLAALMLMFGLGFHAGTRGGMTAHGQVTVFGYSTKTLHHL